MVDAPLGPMRIGRQPSRSRTLSAIAATAVAIRLGLSDTAATGSTPGR